MNLAGLLPLLYSMPAFRQLVERLQQNKSESRASVLQAAKPCFIAALHQQLRLPLLVITAKPEAARSLYDQLTAWTAVNTQVQLFPEPDTLPYEHLTPDPSTVRDRLQTLWKLSRGNTSSSPVVISSAVALTQKTIARADFLSASHILKLGMSIDPLQLIARWQKLGYELEDAVEVPGTISRRGGIIDIYPPNSDLPLRIEFAGNRIESLRLFHPQTQRSLKLVEEMDIIPAREEIALSAQKQVLPEPESYVHLFNTDTILDYLPQEALLILDEPAEIEQAVNELDSQAREIREGALRWGEPVSTFPIPYLTWPELAAKLESEKQHLVLERWAAETSSLLPFSTTPSYAGRLPDFLQEVERLLAQEQRLIVVSYQAARLSELLGEKDIIAPPSTELTRLPPPGSVTLIQGSLPQGWALAQDPTILFSDAEIFGIAKQQRQAKRRIVRHQVFLSELSPGEYVVHMEHGVARFAGMTQMSSNGSRKEYLVLEYAAGDKLYVPTDQVDQVSRYIGPGEQPPALSRLHTQEWSRTKQRVKQSLAVIAEELLELYAAREVIESFAFHPDTNWQQELEASFPYVETPDQMEAVTKVKDDLEKPKPMDRLVCGDVGYGKTEVALRAAFKVVMEGKQVAMLVPTTVLAQQHFTTFSQRLAAFPVKVEMLSRFRSEKEQQAIIEGLASGAVDICIGTHRLLQKDVVFKDLGLVIIDEEQRFGVIHKERLKQMRQEVHVLTLSATPIPRTLHLSLVGVRDLSTIETPPEDRLPIKTYITEYDDRLIREAILRELERNGQVFFVHNRVQTISAVADHLTALLPEAVIAVGHGQMPEEELEKTMWDFSQGKSDVLVATTIIESGLDIPNANTLIVNQADKLGLTQLYQLRGRIGRSSQRAYAYFLFPKGKTLTQQAQKRLQTIFEATEMGAGFHIAMKDLEIRGAGNLLGTAQSGYISAVGFDLYSRLLAEAVEELKTRQGAITTEKVTQSVLSPAPSPTVDLPLPAFLPDGYVPHLATRLALYQRLVRISSLQEIDDLAKELADRFGDLPAEANSLLYLVKVKVLAAAAGVESVAAEGREIVLRLKQGGKFARQLLELKNSRGVKVGTSQLRLNLEQVGRQWQAVLEEVLKRLGTNPGIQQ